MADLLWSQAGGRPPPPPPPPPRAPLSVALLVLEKAAARRDVARRPIARGQARFFPPRRRRGRQAADWRRAADRVRRGDLARRARQRVAMGAGGDDREHDGHVGGARGGEAERELGEGQGDLVQQGCTAATTTRGCVQTKCEQNAKCLGFTTCNPSCGNGYESSAVNNLLDAGSAACSGVSGTRQDSYRSCQTKTVSGKTCQKWTAQSRCHSRTPSNYPNKGLGDHSYCLADGEVEDLVLHHLGVAAVGALRSRSAVLRGTPSARRRARPPAPSPLVRPIVLDGANRRVDDIHLGSATASAHATGAIVAVVASGGQARRHPQELRRAPADTNRSDVDFEWKSPLSGGPRRRHSSRGE